ncbi:MAG: TIGR03435 family protein, partial [Rudaea sp.]
ATAVVLTGQAPTPAPAFEVASVKQNTSGSIIADQNFANGRYTATNLSVFALIAIAYAPMPRSRISGGPGWINADHFDVLAKTDGNASQGQLPAMLRSLLAERFKFAAHTEKRDADVYDLTVARNGQLGSGLRHSTANCTPVDAPPATGQATVARCPAGTYPGRIAATAITLPMLARLLMPWVDQREVRDHTGLDGRFDVELSFTPDRAPRLPPNAPDDLRRAVEAIDPNGPSLFTAVQEQLGLKLESTKAPVEVLVIDHVEHPTPD